MPGAGKNRLVLTAGACCFASALLVGIPVHMSTGLRFFSAGVLFGTAILVLTFSQSRWFK